MDFHKLRKSKNDETWTPYEIIDDKIAEYIIHNIYMFVMNGKPYIYEEGVYICDDDCNILRFYIKQMIIQDVITINRINRVLNLILSDPQLKKSSYEVNRYPDSWINFENGMFDVVNWEMHDHSPKYLSINQIPHGFYHNVDMKYNQSVCKEFLESTIPDEYDREMLLEYIGYCLTKDTSLQKFLIITGIGGTGKSVIIRLIEKVVGRKNISSLSLQDLNKRFYPTNLFGKLLNSCADIPKTAMEETDTIKKITGEDTILGEYKGGALFDFRSYAKLLFSANEIPVTLDEKTNAFFRRFLILRISKRGKEIENLEQKLESEVLILLGEVVKALGEVYKNKGICEGSNSKQLVSELYQKSDSVYHFLSEECDIISPGESNYDKWVIKRGILLEQYSRFCYENDRTPLKRNSFYDNVEKKGIFNVKRCGEWYFKGIKFKDTHFEDAVETPFKGS